MSGTFTISGLASGLDWESMIEQLVAIETQPITRIQEQISGLESQKTAISGLRTTLQTLYYAVQDFSLSDVFDQYGATTSDEEVLGVEVTGSSPVAGSYVLDVVKLASATYATSSSSMGAAIDPDAALNSSGMSTEITQGEFSINGVVFTVDPDTDSLNDILAQINASEAGVTATYDSASDTVTIRNTAVGDTSVINFGGGADDEDDIDDTNFLSVIAMAGATQSDNEDGSTQVESTRNLGAVSASQALSNVNFAEGAVTAGTFKINGITFTVDPTTDSISDVIADINGSDAGVTASYDTTTDTIRFVSDTLGSRTINFSSGTSNLLEVTNLDTATQVAGSDCQFTVNGGAVQTRNTNDVSDAIAGVTLSFESTGTSTVTVKADNDAIVEDIQGFLDDFNAAIEQISSLVAQGGALQGDSSIQTIKSYLQQLIFSKVTNATGGYDNLLDIGISTGDSFDSQSVATYELDSEKLLEALRDDKDGVESLFTNSKGTGIADVIDDYLKEIVSYSGTLNARCKSNGTIDLQIESYNSRMDRLELRISAYEERLRKKFIAMDQLVSLYQSQSSVLSSLG